MVVVAGIVVVVVETHGTVVVEGLSGMHGGSDVDVVDPVSTVVVVPGTSVVVVVVPAIVVVVVPGGAPWQPKDCSSDVKIGATPGKFPKAAWTDRSS
ncbi:MAG: hypothetical protein M3203_08075 [Actinomycetota bacterium]|nr:hypothetical protein [Actinomycetota bacterium]